MTRITKVSIVSVLTVSALLPGMAKAQKKQVSRRDLLSAVISQRVETIEVKEITMSGGQMAAQHLHPCPVVGYIKSGKVLFQIDGEKETILGEGEAFYEPKNKKILHFDNAQKDKPLIFVAFYLKEADEESIKLLEE